MAEEVREVTMREIRNATGGAQPTLSRRALRETWPYREIPAPGRPRRLYRVSALPADIRERLDIPVTESPSGQTEGEAGAVPASPQGPLNAPSTTVESPADSDKTSQSVPPDALVERYEALPESRREAARAKLAAVESALAISARDRIPMSAACERAASGSAWSATTLLAAWRAVRGLPAHLKAPTLADRRRGRTRRAECDRAAFEAFKADYLRGEQRGWRMRAAGRSRLPRQRSCAVCKPRCRPARSPWPAAAPRPPRLACPP